MTSKAPASKPRWRVLLGINWPDGKGGEHRAEPGDLLTAADLKHAHTDHLVALGAIEAAGKEDDE